jgi:hypothetical protein
MKVLQTLVLICGLICFAGAQQKEKLFTLSGTVRNYKEEKAGVPLTEVVAENKDGRSFKTVSDENGFYRLSIPFGEYTLVFHHDGYKITKVMNFENSSAPEKTFEAYLDVSGCDDCGVLIPEPENKEVKKAPATNDSSSLKDEKKVTVLSGTVYDELGAVIANAKITVRGPDGNDKLIKTNDDGVFEIKLIAGNYSIQAESPGFQVFKIEKYRIVPSYKGKLNLDVVLEVRPCDDCHWIDGDPVNENKKPK